MQQPHRPIVEFRDIQTTQTTSQTFTHTHTHLLTNKHNALLSVYIKVEGSVRTCLLGFLNRLDMNMTTVLHQVMISILLIFRYFCPRVGEDLSTGVP
ncbi:hypothetical protein Y032_0004g2115 [Ancylostoma ceylanicum]|uniref:Uncharacterized protein n=1 Tax=Ancylostoma ceylanicum TaxID=53326 RepID=A0A016VUS1_9BILA|nr:hypothetical protein Y032_0004g2115 [Ancylostoma ceylanicum]